jgi:phosphoserine phosphatase
MYQTAPDCGVLPTSFGDGQTEKFVARSTDSAAVLDLDGTLYPGALGLDWLQALTDAGVCSAMAGQRVLAIVDAHRRGTIDFPTMAARAYGAFASMLAGVEVEIAEAIARSTWQQHRGRLFAFVPELISCLREHGHEPILISGSPVEMVELAAEELGIAVARGAVFGRDAGRYTGTVDLSSGSPGEKPNILAAIAREHGRALALDRCFALGNSMTDAWLFERVGVPLVFEPDADLLALAEAHGWRVATRQDVITCTRSLLSSPQQARDCSC